MRKNDQLFRLIKKMDSAEKAFFKKHSGLFSDKKNTNYVKLFDRISRQEMYDEDKIIASFRGEKMVNNFSVAKKYLYDAILKSLRMFESERDIRFQLANLYEDALILFRKGMIGEAHSKIKKLKKQARRLELEHMVIAAVNLERKLVANFNMSGFARKMNALLDETFEAAARVRNLVEYYRCYYAMYDRQTKQESKRKEKDRYLLDEMMRNEYMSDPENALSFHALDRYLNTHMFYQRYIGNELKAYEFSRRSVQHWQQNPHIIETYITSYLAIIHAHLVACIRVSAFDEYFSTIDALKKLRPSSTWAAYRLFEMIGIFSFVGNYNLGRVAEMKEAMIMIEEGIETYKQYIRPLMLVGTCGNIAAAAIKFGNYDEAIKWSNMVLNTAEAKEVSTDKYMLVRLLNLVAHFESGHLNMIPSLVRSIKRDMENHDRLFTFEKSFLRFISKATKHYGTLELKDYYRSYQKELEGIFQDPKQALINNMFSFDVWIDAKVKGIPLHEHHTSLVEADIRRGKLKNKDKVG